MSESYDQLLYSSAADKNGNQLANCAAQLSDGSALWMIYNVAAGRYEIYACADRVTPILAGFINDSIQSGPLWTPSNYSGAVIFTQTMSLVVDNLDNFYVTGLSAAQDATLTVVAFTKGAGLTWTKQTPSKSTTVISIVGAHTALWCNTGGGTGVKGHIFILALEIFSGQHKWETFDAGIALAGAGANPHVSSGANPTFSGTSTSASYGCYAIAQDASFAATGLAAGVYKSNGLASTLFVGAWGISSAGALTTSTNLSISEPCNPVTNGRVSIVRTAANQYLLVCPSHMPSQSAYGGYGGFNVSKWTSGGKVGSTSVSPIINTAPYFYYGDSSTTLGWDAYAFGGKCYIVSVPAVGVPLVATQDITKLGITASTMVWDTVPGYANTYGVASPSNFAIANIKLVRQPVSVFYEDFFCEGVQPSQNQVMGGFDYLGSDVPNAPVITSVIADPNLGWTFISATGQSNILSANDADFETSVGTWAALANCSISRITTQFNHGAASLQLSSTAAGNMSAQVANASPTTYAVSSNTQYTARADFKSAASVRSCRVDIIWYTAGGALISTSAGTAANDATGGWTSLLCTAVSPGTAAFARVTVNVLATAAGAELHWVDKVGIMPNVAAWDVGGMLATQLAVIEYSDDGTNWFIVRGANYVATSQTSAQTYSSTDLEGIPTISRTYRSRIRGQVVVTAFRDSLNSAGSAITPVVSPSWVLKDPTDFASQISVDPLDFKTSRIEQSGQFNIIGRTYPVVIADSLGGDDGELHLEFFTKADFVAMEGLVNKQAVLCLQSPYGTRQYIRFSSKKQAGFGGAGGGGNLSERRAELHASSLAQPHRDWIYYFVEVDRPPV